jgi:hypothetical protein
MQLRLTGRIVCVRVNEKTSWYKLHQISFIALFFRFCFFHNRSNQVLLDITICVRKKYLKQKARY